MAKLKADNIARQTPTIKYSEVGMYYGYGVFQVVFLNKARHNESRPVLKGRIGESLLTKARILAVDVSAIGNRREIANEGSNLSCRCLGDWEPARVR